MVVSVLESSFFKPRLSSLWPKGVGQLTIVMLLSKLCLLFALILLVSSIYEVNAEIHDHKINLDSNLSALAGTEFPDQMSVNTVFSSATNADCSLSTSTVAKQAESVVKHGGDREIQQDDCDNDDDEDDMEGNENEAKQIVKLYLKRMSANQKPAAKELFEESKTQDLTRIQALNQRIMEKKNRKVISSPLKDKQQSKKSLKPVVAPAPSPEFYSFEHPGQQLMATLASGVSLGSGEYFMDVFIGTPPKHFSLILDTGSDLNWIQCVPCYDCFEQNGPYYDPKQSSSFKNISCHDPRCQLVSSPDPPQPCKYENQTCPYYYWYGDSSNTTGDFALETFTVNLTSRDGKSEFRQVENVMFGCGHWNRGLFHGAAGLLGLGRGPLSFSSQLKSLYGHSFSYCLVDRNSDANVSSKLIFGEDKNLLSHPELNFTSLVSGKENLVETFYYVQIKSIIIGGEVLNIPEETWRLSGEGAGGTIVDSGTTLSYFADPAYKIIRDAFVKKVKGYPLIKDFPILDPCYNVSGVEKMELPEFGIVFADGAVWNFPVENYFIRLEPEEIVCLAILGTPRSALSIIGNYQQQNFHILYDTKKSRIGYAPMRCADV